MLRPLLRLASLSAVFVLGPGLPASAQMAPRSVNDCERLKNDLAYNQCLAMFGPAAKNVAGGFVTDGAPGSSGPPAALAAIPLAEEPVEETRSSRRGSYRTRRHGRQSAVFTAGGETRSYRRRRRH